MDNTQYVIDANNFDGTPKTVLLDNGLVAYSSVLYNNGKGALTFEEYQEKVGGNLKVVNREELDALSKNFWVSEPEEISNDKLLDAFECLPPEDYINDHGFERFNMMEYLSGSYTRQYATYKGKNLVKVVDVTDKSTYITKDDFKKFGG